MIQYLTTDVKTYTKKDIANLLITSFPEKTSFLNKLAAVDIILSVFKKVLIQKNCINMIDIGYLCPKFKEKRDGARNPKTNDEHSVDAHWTVTRRLGKNEQPTYIHTYLIDALQSQLSGDERFQKKKHVYAGDLLTEFYQIVSTVKTGKARFEFRNFGNFIPVYQQTLIKRNPKTGEHIQKDAHYKIHFKLSKSLHDQINETNIAIDKHGLVSTHELAVS
jgi:nucleoid DNA-binding protein